MSASTPAAAASARRHEAARLVQYSKTPQSVSTPRTTMMAWQSPSQRPEQAVAPTVVHFKHGAYQCPVCQTASYADVSDFKSHVLECRVDHNIDPLLPMTLIRSLQPTPPSTGAAKRASLGSTTGDMSGTTPRSGGGSRRSISTPNSSVKRPVWNLNAGPGADELDAVLRPISSGVERIELFGGRPAPRPPPLVDPPKRTPVTLINSKLCDDLRFFMAQPPSADAVLTLQGLQIAVKDASILHQLLADWQLVVTAIDFSDSSALNRDAEHLIVRSIMKNRYVGSLKLDNCTFAARLDAPAVKDHLTVNMKRRDLADREAHFEAWVKAYRSLELTAKAEFTALYEGETQGRASVFNQEMHERANVCKCFDADAMTLALRLKRRATKKAFQEKMLVVEREETESRAAGMRLEQRDMLTIVAKLEQALRSVIINAREAQRLNDKTVERTEIFQAKGRERQRLAHERQQREFFAQNETKERESLVQKYDVGREVILTQMERHERYLAWRKAQRDEVLSLFKYESAIREGLLKEEANVFVSSREKFQATIKGVLAKYAQQREDLEAVEASVRHYYLFNFEALLAYEGTVFQYTAKLIRLRAKAKERDAQRLQLLRVVPTVTVAMPSVPALYVMPAQGQPHPPFMAACPDARISVALPSDWVSKLQEVESRCKACATEERAIMTELLTLHLKEARTAETVRRTVLGVCMDGSPAPMPSTPRAAVLPPSPSGSGKSVDLPRPYHQRQPSPTAASAAANKAKTQQEEDDELDAMLRSSLSPKHSESAGPKHVWLRSAPFPPGFTAKTTTRPSSGAGANANDKDEAFVYARDACLALRSAWFDPMSAAMIASAKETVTGGELELWCESAYDESDDDDHIATGVTPPLADPSGSDDDHHGCDTTEHRVDEELTTLQRDTLMCEFDDVPYSEIMAQRALPPADASPAANKQADSKAESDVEKTSESKEASILVPAGGAVELRSNSSSVPPDGLEQDQGDEGAEGDAANDEEEEDKEPPTAKALLRVRLEEVSGSATASLQRDEHHLPKPHVPKNVVGSLLTAVQYRCAALRRPRDAKQGTVRSLRYRLTLELEWKDCYAINHVATVDRLGYSPLVPTSGSQRVTTTVEGAIVVGVAPSPFRFPNDAPLPDDRVFVEMQKEDMPLLPPLAGILMPPQLTKLADDSWAVVTEPPNSEGYAGALVTVEFIGRHVSAADRLSVKEDINLQLSVTDRTSYCVRSMTLHNKPLCSVEAGVVQSTRHVRTTNATGTVPSVALRMVSAAEGAAEPIVVLGEAVRAVLSRLHYHNTATDGVDAGPRHIRLTIQTRYCSICLYTRFEVEEIDAPTEIRLAHTSFLMRQPLILPPKDSWKAAVQTQFIPIALGAVVFDEDTDRFGGGYMHVYLSSATKGDSMALCTKTSLVYPVFEAVCVPDVISVSDAGDVSFEGRVVAKFNRGKLIRQPGDEVNCEGEDEVHLLLAGDDQCSIKAVEAILRHIVFFTLAGNVGPKGHQPTGAVRDVTLDVEIGDGEQACRIEHVVQIKPAGTILSISDKATAIEVKEGAAQTRVGPLDNGADRFFPATSFNTGWVLVSVATGFEEGDQLNLKDDVDYKLVEPAAVPAPPKGKKLAPDVVRKAEDAFRNRCGTLTCSGAYVDLAEPVLAKSIKAFEIAVPGVKEPLGLVTWHDSGRHMLMQFYAEMKGTANVPKKVVAALLRSITYQHQVADPQMEMKVLRVQCSDGANVAPSQAHVAVSIALVDDVTQILIAKQRRKYRFGMEPYGLFPHGMCLLSDDDTEYFDGGHVIVNVAGSGLKGEQLFLCAPQSQFLHPADIANVNPGLAGPLFSGVYFTETEVRRSPMINDEDGSTIEDHCLAIITRGGKEGSSIEIKLAFPPLPPDFSGDGVVSLELASYLLNCVCYQCDSDRTKDATRIVSARIHDAENPVDGKTKYTLDVSPSIIAAVTPLPPQIEPPLPMHRAVAPAAMPGASVWFGRLATITAAWEKLPAAGRIDCFVTRRHSSSFVDFAHTSRVLMQFEESGVPSFTLQTPTAGLPVGCSGNVVFKEKDAVATLSPLHFDRTTNRLLGFHTGTPVGSSSVDSGATPQPPTTTPPSGSRSSFRTHIPTAKPPVDTIIGVTLSWGTQKLKLTKAQLSNLLRCMLVSVGTTDAGYSLECTVLCSDATMDSCGRFVCGVDVLST